MERSSHNSLGLSLHTNTRTGFHACSLCCCLDVVNLAKFSSTQAHRPDMCLLSAANLALSVPLCVGMRSPVFRGRQHTQLPRRCSFCRNLTYAKKQNRWTRYERGGVFRSLGHALYDCTRCDGVFPGRVLWRSERRCRHDGSSEFPSFPPRTRTQTLARAHTL